MQLNVDLKSLLFIIFFDLVGNAHCYYSRSLIWKLQMQFGIIFCTVIQNSNFQFANFAPISYYISIASKMQCVHDTHLLLALPFLITLETGLSMHLCIVQYINQEMLELVLDGARKYSCNARPSLHVHHDASSKWFEPMFVRQMDG